MYIMRVVHILRIVHSQLKPKEAIQCYDEKNRQEIKFLTVQAP